MTVYARFFFFVNISKSTAISAIHHQSIWQRKQARRNQIE